MSQPTQTCTLCGLVEIVVPDGRGFPPKIAQNRLKKRCAVSGCPSEPVYRAGVSPALAKIVEEPELPEILGYTIRALSPDTARSYPELLERTLDMAREALTQRITDGGYSAVGDMYLRIDIEQMAYRR